MTLSWLSNTHEFSTAHEFSTETLLKLIETHKLNYLASSRSGMQALDLDVQILLRISEVSHAAGMSIYKAYVRLAMSPLCWPKLKYPWFMRVIILQSNQISFPFN